MTRYPRPGKVWITGAGGLIGNYLLLAAAEFVPQDLVIPLTRQQLDLTDFDAVRSRFRKDRPATIIHCAALSRSPVCEENPALAHRINVDATKVLADLAADACLAFFSSDLVFDGHAGNYQESASTNPLSVYGATKVAAEEYVLRNPRYFVIRTSLNGGSSPTGDRGFNEQMRSAWIEGRELTLFLDEFRSPIHAQLTARAVWNLLHVAAPGLYHVAGAERMSRWELGRAVAARWPALNPKIQPASLKEYKGAQRAPDTSLNCAKAQALLSFRLPGMTEWLSMHPHEQF
jgi:dTDP-4-dehydrorhamnose reductase